MGLGYLTIDQFEIGHSRFTYEQKQRVNASGGRSDALGSLALTGCDDKQDKQGGQQMPEVGVVTLKTEPLQITTELQVVPLLTVSPKFARRISGIILKRNFVEEVISKQESLSIRLILRPTGRLTTALRAIWQKREPPRILLN